MSQNIKISYTAVDDETGKEVVGLELRQGLMNEDIVFAQEQKLKAALMDLLDSANPTK